MSAIARNLLRRARHLGHISRVDRVHFFVSYLLGAVTAQILKRFPSISGVIDIWTARQLARSLHLDHVPKVQTWRDDLSFQERYVKAASANKLGDLAGADIDRSSLSPHQLFQLSHVYSSSGQLEKAIETIEDAYGLQHRRSGVEASQDVALLGRNWTGALGHLLSIEHFRRLCDIGILPYKSLVILCQRFPIANRTFLLNLARTSPEITLIQPYDSAKLNKRVDQFELHSLMIHDQAGKKFDLLRCRDIACWTNRESLSPAKRLISEKIRVLGNETLERMGISETDRVVCVNVRSGTHGPGRGLANSDIFSYLKAINYLVETGRKVIRMGDPSAPRLPVLEGVIDLAHSEHKAPWLDLYLWSRADFAIGTNSGGSEGFCLFGVPTIHTNTTNVAWFPYGFKSFMCPKLFKRAGAKNPMSLNEFLTTPWGMSDAPHHPGFDDVEIIDNSPDDIIEAVKEMDSFLTSQKLDLQESTSDAVLKEIRASLGRHERSTISRSFLAQHPYLLA